MRTTGWPPGLLQDDDRRLSQWFASRPDALYQFKSFMNYRNQKLLEAVRHFPCQHCGIQDGTVVAAHSNQLRDGKGRSIKAHDYRIAALCFRCHHELDQGNKLSRQERLNLFEDAHRATIGSMFELGVLEVK